MNDPKRVAVVTGANRGMGFEAARQLAQQGIRVILTSRDAEKGKAAANTLQSEGLDVVAYPLDVASTESIQQFAQAIARDFDRLDILINNAGIYRSPTEPDGGGNALTTSIDAVREVIETNTFGPIQLIQALVPMMQTHRYGRIVNVSSGMGQLQDMGGGFLSYRTSKTALNAITRIFASELRSSNILVNTMCPGWVRTDMGGPNATRSVEEGVDTMVWLATLPNNGPTGSFFRDRKPIAW